jgi:hypothetical protein
MGTGESVWKSALTKKNLGKTAQTDEKRRYPCLHRNLPFGAKYDDGDVHPEHLFPKRDTDPIHQGQF